LFFAHSTWAVFSSKLPNNNTFFDICFVAVKLIIFLQSGNIPDNEASVLESFFQIFGIAGILQLFLAWAEIINWGLG